MADIPTSSGRPLGDDNDDRPPPARTSRDTADQMVVSGWPTDWPRLTQRRPPIPDTQTVLFVGGTADGLLDEVPLSALGQLPERIRCLGSVYGLAQSESGLPPEFRFLGSAEVPGSATQDVDLDNPTTLGRERAAQLRDQAGRRRDVAADSRDEAGTLRDADAEQRDRQAEHRRHTASGAGADFDLAERAAAIDRDSSRVDRGVGAADRRQGQRDRSHALADRSAAARDRRHALIDVLTGVYSREAGLMELDRDVARVARTGHRLVLAFVDVDGLKQVNDRHGHAAGDRLLQAVATTLQEALRSYDVVIRYGGDGFLCVIQGIDLAIAVPRFARVNRLLAQQQDSGSVTVGLAVWQPGESAAELIQRADADLYRQRNQRTGRLRESP